MGQKIHPEGFRVGYIHDWKSNWFNEREFADYLMEDIHIREHIENKLSHAGLSDITIVKGSDEIEVDIATARPGIVIGKSGSEVDALRKELHKITGRPVKVNIKEIKRPELDAKLVAQSIAEQLQNRVAFRRAMKRALTSAMRSGAKGVKVQVSGPPRRRRDGAHRGLLRRPRAAAHPARRHRLRLHRGPHDDRPHRRQVLDQQGRGHARGLPPAGRRGRGRRRIRRRPRRPRGSFLMLMPKRVKYRKQMRGRMRGYAKGGTTIAFDQATASRRSNEAGSPTARSRPPRVAMTRKIKRGGKVWINIFPRPTGDPEAGGNPDGLRQGRPRGLISR